MKMGRVFERKVTGAVHQWQTAAAVLGAVWALAVPAFGAVAPRARYVEGEVIVTFKASAGAETARQKLAAHSLQFARRFDLLSKHSNREHGLIRSADRTTAELIAELSTDPDVEVVEPNHLRWISKAAPNDTQFSSLWGLNNSGQVVNGTAGVAGADIEYVGAWSLARTSSVAPVVAVIDTGLDGSHPDLAGSLWFNPNEIPGNDTDDDGNGYVDDVNGYDFSTDAGDFTDSGEHGTHIAGTIAAVRDNGLGVAGVNPEARLMALKASTDGSSFSSSAIIEALQYATAMKARGVNIVAINASFGGGDSNSVERAAIQAAGSAGIVFCAAAGNSALNHDVTADYPASYRLSNMIVIAASTATDALASFSDYGATTVDLAAPGMNILSTVPAVASRSVSLASTNFAAYELTHSGFSPGVTGTIYDCGLGYPTNFPAGVSNNLALIKRGTLYFSEKVANAMKAGAAAVIIYNNVSGSFAGTLRYVTNWVPAVTVSLASGTTLKALAPVKGTVTVAFDASQSFALLSGTSMATPHVAGAVAFAAMNFPTDTVAQRVQRVLANAEAVAGLQGTVITGGRLNLRRIVDSDLNSLPDWWEQGYFGRLVGQSSNADPDGDGASDLAEWIAGTDPTDSASSLRLHTASVLSNGGVVIRWPSVAGRAYCLERSTDLAGGFRQVVRSNIVATPPFNTLTDIPSTTGGSAYYRIGVEE